MEIEGGEGERRRGDGGGEGRGGEERFPTSGS